MSIAALRRFVRPARTGSGAVSRARHVSRPSRLGLGRRALFVLCLSLCGAAGAAPQLLHRWSFNGSLADSVGGSNAVYAGSAPLAYDNAGAALSLAGGTRGTSWVSLGTGVVPEGCFTLEVFARERALRYSSGVFELGSGLADSLRFAWSCNSEPDRQMLQLRKAGAFVVNAADAFLPPFSLGDLYHVTVTVTTNCNGAGASRLTLGRRNLSTGETPVCAEWVTPSAWSPADLGDALLSLGNSPANDWDPSADYDEVRVWDGALSGEQLAENAVLGPDCLPGDFLRVSGEPLACGAVTPAYGATGGLGVNDEIDCSAVAPTGGDGLLATCRGYVVYAITNGVRAGVLAEGADSTYRHRHPGGGCELVWKWGDVSAKVEVTAPGGLASLSPSSATGFYPLGSTVTVTASPAAGQAFFRWAGDPPASLADANPMALSVDRPRAFEAVFGRAWHVAPDGLAAMDGASWETATTLANAVASAADGDVVVLTNGSYDAGATLSVSAAVAVRSLTGDWRDVTVGGGGGRRVFTLSNPGARLSGVTVVDGKGDGPGVCLAGGGTLARCRVTRCAVNTHGAVWNQGGTVADCLVDGNYTAAANPYFYGIGLRQEGAASVTERCVITNNCHTSEYGAQTISGITSGSGASVAGGVFRNCLVGWNSLGYIGDRYSYLASGVYLKGGVVEGCTVVENTYKGPRVDEAFGLYCEYGWVANCLVAGNGAATGSAVSDCGGRGFAYVNCRTSRASELFGLCNAEAGPDAYVVQDGIPRIVAGSPCLDAGGELPATSELDLLGRPRVAGAAPDVGAVETPAAGFFCPFAVSASAGLDSLEATLTPLPTGDAEGAIYCWDFDGDGTTDLVAADPSAQTRAWGAVGDYAVTLCATNSFGDASTWTRRLRVTPSVHYVVPAGTAGHAAAAPYATWDTAATNIQDAVDVAQDGARVIVSNGIYEVRSATLSIAKGVAVRGLTGRRGDVVIDGVDSQRRCVLLASAGAVLDGVTICRGGGVSAGPGLYIDGAGCLTNSRVTDCRAAGYGRGCVYNGGGLLVDCAIDGNTSDNIFTGNALFQCGDYALADRCAITNNYRAESHLWSSYRTGQVAILGGALRNSLVAWNTLGRATKPGDTCSGVLLAKGLVENCSIIGNRYGGGRNDNVHGAVRAGGVFRNCLIADNSPEGLPVAEGSQDNWLHAGGGVGFDHCATYPAAGLPAGNVEADSAAYAVRGGFPALVGNSPCLDAGAPVAWADPPATDLAGAPRRSGEAVDIGCCEFDAAGFDCLFRATKTVGLGSLETTVTAVPGGNVTGVVYHWDWDGDGVYEDVRTDASPIEKTFSEMGRHVVGLHAANAAGREAVWSETFVVAPPVLYVVKDNAAAAPPFDTRATAASNVYQAVEAAYGGAVVVVAAGLYPLTNTLVVAKPVAVRGETGDWRDVVFEGNQTFRGVTLSGPGVALSGVTVRNCRDGAGQGSGVQIYGGGTLARCRVTECDGGGYAHAAVYNIGGRVVECLIDGNTVGSVFYGCGLCQDTPASFTDRCVITNNVSGDIARNFPTGTGACILAGTLRNSLVAFNRHGKSMGAGHVSSGLFLGGGVAENCTVGDNTFAGDQPSGHGVVHEGGLLVNCLVSGNASRADASLCNFFTTQPDAILHACTTPLDGIADAAQGNVLDDGASLCFGADGLPRLSSGSPCADAGLAREWAARQSPDLRGRNRIAGGAIDIGCVEAQAGDATLFFVR